MWQYFISVILILIVTAIYLIFIKPIKTIRRLTKEFQNVGYKVFTFPYHPLKMPVMQIILDDSESGDPYKTFATKFLEYDVLVSNMLNCPLVAALSPRARKQFSKHQVELNLIKAPQNIGYFSPILGKGLLLSQGNQWKRKRRIVSTFFTHQFIQSKIPEMLEIIESSFNQIQGESRKNNKNLGQDQYGFRLFELTSRMFSNIVLSLFLGTQSLNEEIEGQKVYQFMVKLVADKTLRNFTLTALVLGPKFLDLGITSVDRDINRRVRLYNDWASKYIDKIINNSSSDKRPNNLLQLIYKSRSKDSQTNYSKQQLIDELKIFFFAGTDTTAHFLQMMIYLSVKNKAVYSEARQEIQNFEGSLKNYQALKKLKFIDYIQKQTTRYYGPTPLNFGRVTSRDCLFNGVLIQKDIYMQFYSIPTHYNPEYYPYPFQFNPNRWKNQKQIDGALLTGFGMGPRGCIGQGLALMQSKLAYFCFMKRYSEIRVPEKINLKWKFMNEAQDLQIVVKKRG